MVLLEAILASLIRWGLAAVFGGLVAKSIISPDLYAQITSEGAVELTAWILGFVVPLAWSFWAKYQARVRERIALNLPAGSSPEKLEAEVTRRWPGLGPIHGVLPPLLVLLMLTGTAATFTGCPATGSQVHLSGVEKAKLGYADASLAYEATMLSLQDLRAARLVTDAQWSRIDQAQHRVRKYAPILRDALDLWSASGVQPSAYLETLSKLLAAFAEVKAVKGEVQP